MVCLDTTFIIDLVNGRIDRSYLKDNFSREEIFVPSPAIVELIRGLHLKQNIKNIKQDENEETKKIISSFPTLDLGKEEAVLAGEIDAELSNKGDIIDIEDILIGAICLANDEVLVTKNKKHFEKIPGLQIIGY